jgi:hypothetical protein
MNVNFTKPFTDLEGKTIEGSNTLGQILANSLKFWGWATAMHKGEEVNLDLSDYDTLKNFIKGNKALTVLAKAQLLQTLGEYK